MTEVTIEPAVPHATVRVRRARPRALLAGLAIALVTVSGLAYVVIFSIPLAQKTFMLDSSNMAITSMALGIGLVGAFAIEVIWWVQGRILGERLRMWKQR